MIRDILKQKQSVSKTGFRYRGMESSRLENLTDAVFAFAITLLVIATEVPRTYVELQASMYDFVGFLFCSLLLLGIWNNHHTFFLHYGLRDSFTQTMNFVFLFVLLFYIYPLKYLFSFVGASLLLKVLIWLDFRSEAMKMALTKTSMANMNTDQWEDLMIRFGLGLLLIYLIFGLMHMNAMRKKRELELNKAEIYETRSFIIYYLFLVFIALISMAIVYIGGGAYSAYAGFVYLSIPIILPIIKRWREKRMKKINLVD